MIRGFATNRVLMVADGVRMNNAIYRSGNIQNIIDNNIPFKPKEKYLNRFFNRSFLTYSEIPKIKIHQFKGEKRKSTILDKIKNIK